MTTGSNFFPNFVDGALVHADSMRKEADALFLDVSHGTYILIRGILTASPNFLLRDGTTTNELWILSEVSAGIC